MITYETTQGDTLDAISYRFFGDTPGALEKLVEANPDILSQPLVLPSGLFVTIPEVTGPSIKRREIDIWA